MKCLSRFAWDQAGLASVEFSLLLAFIGLIVAIAMSALASAVSVAMNDISSKISE